VDQISLCLLLVDQIDLSKWNLRLIYYTSVCINCMISTKGKLKALHVFNMGNITWTLNKLDINCFKKMDLIPRIYTYITVLQQKLDLRNKNIWWLIELHCFPFNGMDVKWNTYRICSSRVLMCSYVIDSHASYCL